MTNVKSDCDADIYNDPKIFWGTHPQEETEESYRIANKDNMGKWSSSTTIKGYPELMKHFKEGHNTTNNPLDSQVGGNHYKNMAIQPAVYIHKNGIGFLAGAAIKYLSRKKNGIEDLKKAKHIIEILISLEEDAHAI